MVSTLGDNALALATVKKWAAEFKRRESLEDDPRSGRPSTAQPKKTLTAFQQMVMNDRQLTISHLANVISISHERVENILHNKLGMSKVSTRWVLRLLTPDQKLTRLIMSEANLARFEAADPDRFVERFLTQDKCWVHHFQPETKRQSMQWKHSTSPAPKKAKVVSFAGKMMVSVFWDAKGIAYIDYLQKGKTINGEYYAKLLRELRQAIKSKKPGKQTKDVLLHQDNAPAHKSLVAMSAVHDRGFELIDHPPYSPDLASSDYFLFPNLKKHLAGKLYKSDDDVISAVEDFSEGQEENFYATGIQALMEEVCVDRRGDCVEK